MNIHVIGGKMSKIWSFFMIVAIVYFFIIGNVTQVLNVTINSSKSAIENVITLASIMCFWSGIFKVFESTSLMKKFSKILKYPINLIFGKNNLSEESINYISLNMASNMLGLGNASTINGIKAIKSLQKENNDKTKPNNLMTTFVLINTASIQLIPTTIISLRSTYNSTNPNGVIIPVLTISITALIAGIFSIKFLNKRI